MLPAGHSALEKTNQPPQNVKSDLALSNKKGYETIFSVSSLFYQPC
jgi:hypothetical protein